MTDQELRQYVANLHGSHNQLLEQFGIQNRRLDEATAAMGDATRAVWQTNANVAALAQKVEDHDRRLCESEEWRKKIADQASASGTYKADAAINMAERLVAKWENEKRAEEQKKQEQRRHYVRMAIATVVGLLVTGAAAWASAALGGCVQWTL